MFTYIIYTGNSTSVTVNLRRARRIVLLLLIIMIIIIKEKLTTKIKRIPRK
jgi:hypothetical protein